MTLELVISLKLLKNPCEGRLDSAVLAGTKECHLVDQAQFNDEFLVRLLPHASETTEILVFYVFRVPPSPNEEPKEFLN